jgi:hypothetical protein
MKFTLIACATAACSFAPQPILARIAPPPAPRPSASQPSLREKSPAAALAHGIRTLTEEAKKSKSDGVLVRNSADFAKHFGDPPPEPLVRERLLRPIDRDRFIDAYVRWQLTSFEPDLDAANMHDRDFAALVSSLPACIENPQANPALIDWLQSASKLGALSESQQTEINGRLNDLAAKTSAAAALAIPAMQLRQWFRQQFEAANQPPRFLALLLDAAKALAAAGWPVDDAKAVIDRAAEKAAEHREFTIEQRRSLIVAMQRCITGTRMYVISAGVSEGAISVNYAATGIFDFDVRRWAKAVLLEQ